MTSIYSPFININFDIIKYIALKLDNFNDMISLISASKFIYNSIDDIFFRDFAYKQYSKEFWIIASNRPAIKSKPLGSMYKELVRIEQFQKNQENNNRERWSTNEFYRYWNSLDKL